MTGGPRSVAAPQKAREHRRRADRAVELYCAGATYQHIANDLGISRQSAWKLVQQAFKLAAADRTSDRQALLGRELLMLDRLAAANWERAKTGDHAAIRAVLKAHEGRCKLLGLYAPTRSEKTVASHIDREIEELISKLENR